MTLYLPIVCTLGVYGVLECLVQLLCCPAAVASSISSRAGTLQTSRRSSGFSIQQEAPAGWKGCSFLTGLDFSLTTHAGEKVCQEVLLKNQGWNPPILPTPPTNPLSFRAKMLFYILTYLLGCFSGFCLFSSLPLSVATVAPSFVPCSQADLPAAVHQLPLYTFMPGQRAKTNLKALNQWKVLIFKKFNTGSVICALQWPAASWMSLEHTEDTELQEGFLGQVFLSDSVRVQSTWGNVSTTLI